MSNSPAFLAGDEGQPEQGAVDQDIHSDSPQHGAGSRRTLHHMSHCFGGDQVGVVAALLLVLPAFEALHQLGNAEHRGRTHCKADGECERAVLGDCVREQLDGGRRRNDPCCEVLNDRPDPRAGRSEGGEDCAGKRHPSRNQRESQDVAKGSGHAPGL